ncbi:MAG TPA: hypothetical protein GX012_04600 [Acholeplasma sp.]|nr:hypothetical protein [Acholeplasma sp.]
MNQNLFGSSFETTKRNNFTENAISSELIIPDSAVELSYEEMEYVDGGVDTKFKWYGFNAYFNAVETTQLLGILNMGLGVGGIVAAIGSQFPPVGLVAAVLAGAFLINAGWIQYASAKGNGFTFQHLYVGGIYWFTEGKAW